MAFPLIAPIRQMHDQPRIDDVAGETRRAWQDSSVRGRIRPKMRVAVGVGSRGIARQAEMVRATIDVLREWGAEPFVVAAMGSHGGATPEGQRELLATSGITEDALGVPIRTEMDVVEIGRNSRGEPVWWDRNALSADAVVTVSRIKPHTDFRGDYESGVVKMLAIGLGKKRGAAAHHRWGVPGLRDLMPETGRIVLERTPFVAALAIIENADDETALLQVVERESVLTAEPKLLDTARALMGRLPFDQLDILIIGEIGKNYSGAGIDPNVVGRLLLETAPEPPAPKITRICALDLSPESHGNGTGVGIADLITTRLRDAIDPHATRENSLTACFLWRAKVPLAFPTDRDCLTAAIETCWQPHPEAIRLAIIPNTLELTDLWVSPPLIEESAARAGLESIGDPEPMPFDAQGCLDQERLFPRSWRARRADRHRNARA